MKPIKFSHAYETPLGAGDNPNTGDLPICIARDPDTLKHADPTNRPVHVVSCWQLTPEELDNINKTGVLYVAVMSNEHSRTQPPISIMGFNPFTDYGEEHNYVGVPRSLAAEQRKNLLHLVDTDKHVRETYPGDIGTMLNKWFNLVSPIALGNIEALIRKTYQTGFQEVQERIISMIIGARMDNGANYAAMTPEQKEIPPLMSIFVAEALERARLDSIKE